MIPSEAAPPLAVYIHWPYCARVCPYCDFAVMRDRGRSASQAALVQAIATDLAAHAARTGPRRLVSVFFGGGTPSLMPPADVARLVALARALWTADAALEVTLEANPTDAEAGRFAAFAAAGVTRLSLGVQALDDVALAWLGRNHGAAEALRAVAAAQRAFPRVALDLIYALPGQTVEDWVAALSRAAGLGAEHLSPYQLTIEPGTAFDRARRRGALVPPTDELGADLYAATQETLQAHGYDAYEVSNHARGLTARARHNLAYWRGEDYVGVGPSAHGRLTLDGRRTATQAARAPPAYLAAVSARGSGAVVEERLDAVAAAEERLMMGLRLAEGLPLADVAALPLAARPELEAAGLVRVGAGRLFATARGRLVLNAVVARLCGA